MKMFRRVGERRSERVCLRMDSSAIFYFISFFHIKRKKAEKKWDRRSRARLAMPEIPSQLESALRRYRRDFRYHFIGEEMIDRRHWLDIKPGGGRFATCDQRLIAGHRNLISFILKCNSIAVTENVNRLLGRHAQNPNKIQSKVSPIPPARARSARARWTPNGGRSQPSRAAPANKTENERSAVTISGSSWLYLRPSIHLV